MTPGINPETVKAFQERIMTWWAENARDLPWRRNPSPYHVLVSEVMLQQTQVSRVVPKYIEFMSVFPTIESLASADTRQLLLVWSGLGYNRRALWLKEAAREIVQKEEFPQTIQELQELKGIGPYTSRSILIFGFNHDIATVDTNIRRILISAGFADEDMGEKGLQEVADQLLLPGRSRDWHNALMDYGSLVLTSSATGISPVTKQTCYEGSSRQIRGAIIRALTTIDEVELEELKGLLDCEVRTSELELIIGTLVSEGLVEESTQGYRIAR